MENRPACLGLGTCKEMNCFKLNDDKGEGEVRTFADLKKWWRAGECTNQEPLMTSVMYCMDGLTRTKIQEKT